MRRVFADTYYWIALLNDRDQGHAAARAISQTLPQPGIVTTQEVLSEVLTYFCAYGRQVRQTIAAFIRQILTDPAITVHPQSSQSFLSGLALYEARPKATTPTHRSFAFTSQPISVFAPLLSLLQSPMHYDRLMKCWPKRIQRGIHMLLNPNIPD